jgi:hypothetical protein
MRRLAACVVAAVVAFAAPAYLAADSPLVFDTRDWRFEAPESLGTQADLELTGTQIQLCTDEIARLIHYRP